MSKALPARVQRSRGRDGATYTCTDNIKISTGCKYKVFEADNVASRRMGLKNALTAPKNGILLSPG